MNYLSLDGDWTLRHADEKAPDRFPSDGVRAVVPGCVHTDLLREGIIDDPYYRDNELAQMWVGETGWLYSRTFRVDSEFLSHERVELVCEGLDTLAEITVNGRSLGRVENAFRTWRFDVASVVSPGENTIEIRFDAPVPEAARRSEQEFYWHTGIGAERLLGVNHLRKSQCNFGWDWGPRCATSGIWRPIRLVAFDGGRIADLRVAQDSLTDDAAELTVHVTSDLAAAAANAGGRRTGTRSGAGASERRASDRASGDTTPSAVRVRAQLDGADVAVGTASLADGAAEVALHIAEPKRWWPNGAGEQTMYTVACDLLDEQGQVLDRHEKRIGLRSVRLVREPDEWGESFHFEVNGRPVFAKGANWIPADTFVTRVSVEHYRRLLQSAADAHMNMLRVWGGGIYEEDFFYDLCDELGLLVWQDFMFACAAYPTGDEFLANITAEAEEQIRRLRHHPSVALWCGNNELEQIHPCIGDGEDARAGGAMTWEAYVHLFDELLAGCVAELDPERDYWPSSPHTPGAKRGDANDPNAGDAHLWMVWHGRQPFEAYRECEHRFNSEFGFQSFPEPEAVAKYAGPGERNITSRIMEHHQRSPIGNDAIVQYMLEWFQLPSREDMVLWTSQILQGLAVTYGVEHWRRSAPRGMGTIYWQLNDCWPVASWSSIDWEGRWKALHYLAVRAYAPLLLSTIVDDEAGTITLYVTSDEPQPCRADVQWKMWTVDGECIALGEEDVDIPAAGTVEVVSLEFDEQIEQLGAHSLILLGTLTRDGRVESDAMASFLRPKHLDLRDPQLRVQRQPMEGDIADAAGYRETWTIEADKPALWVWPDVPGSDLRYSDRFFHLEPGTPRSVVVGARTAEAAAREEWRKAVGRVYSLFDTYRVDRG